MRCIFIWGLMWMRRKVFFLTKGLNGHTTKTLRRCRDITSDELWLCWMKQMSPGSVVRHSLSFPKSPPSWLPSMQPSSHALPFVLLRPLVLLHKLSVCIPLLHLHAARIKICINTTLLEIVAMHLFVLVTVCVSAELSPPLFISLRASVSVTPLVSAALPVLQTLKITCCLHTRGGT